MTYHIDPVSHGNDGTIQATIDGKTKPLGALGQLEEVAKNIARVQYLAEDNNTQNKLVIEAPSLFIFAGDHGIVKEGVSIAPSEVTGQMVANFANGGAAINVFCRQLGWQLNVVDAGILHAPKEELDIISQRLGDITQPFNQSSAMSIEQVELGFDLSKELIKKTKATGSNLVAFGEMGIGNTSSASALMSAFLALPATETVGKGTGVSDDIVLKKIEVVQQALALHAEHLTAPKEILARLGGHEIVQITGAMLAAAEEKMHIVVDGFICTAAAIAAIKINANVKDYMIFAHCSGEQGHQKMLAHLEVTPLLDLGLRLGEGTGAALALPLIQASVNFYNEMASFAQAEVTNVV